jgi:hypothetical protein
VVDHASGPSYLGDEGRRNMSSRPGQAKLARSYLKNKIKQKPKSQAQWFILAILATQEVEIWRTVV